MSNILWGDLETYCDIPIKTVPMRMPKALK